MRRYKLLASIALLCLVLLTTGAVLIVLLRHEKSFYSRLEPPAGPEREQESTRCLTKLLGLTANMDERNPDAWEAHFTAKELNSFFAEDFESHGISEQMLPDDVSGPRVSFEEDSVIRLGFRYGKRPWRTLMTIAFRVWLAKDEANAICVELISIHAGGLPVSAQGILERVFDVARRQGIEVAWYNYNGHQTAVLRFPSNMSSNQSHATVLLKTLQVKDGELIIGGQASEMSPLRAWLTPKDRNPQEATD
jgi:hypothetical protein